MTIARFTELRSFDDLARATGTAVEQITEYAGADKQSDYYHVLRIPKRGRGRAGQFRVVHHARTGILQNFHRMIALMMAEAISFGPHVQGFVQKRSIVTNARAHLGAPLLLHADISDFFDSVTREQVEQGFISIGARPEIAALLARTCTIDDRLRQGTRCAPAIANMVCRPLDSELLDLAAAHRATYTRYADDITFSGNEVPDSKALASKVEKYGFRLRAEKCRIQRRGTAQFVTGLHIGDATQPRLQRRLKRRLRLVLHFIEKYGMDGHFSRQTGGLRFGDPLELAGLLRFAQSIEPDLVKKFRAQFQAGSAKSRADAPHDPLDDYQLADDEEPYDPGPEQDGGWRGPSGA